MGHCLSSSTAPHLRLSVTSLCSKHVPLLGNSPLLSCSDAVRMQTPIVIPSGGRLSIICIVTFRYGHPKAFRLGRITLPRVLSLMPSSSHSARPSAYQMENVLAHSPAVQIVWRR